jgi:hypothetical protein
MQPIDQLRRDMTNYENQLGGYVTQLGDIESELNSVASHTSSCQVLREAYSDLEDSIVSDCFSTPKSNINSNITTIRRIRQML